MGCYHPIPAHQDRPGGKVTLWPKRDARGKDTDTLVLPCGNCLGCLADRATAWGNRCTHELSRWDHNSFVTLTYDEEHLPLNGHLDAGALTRFIKRLRKQSETRHTSIIRDWSSTLRYLACGEYGTQNQRPHYHILTFNCGFADQYRVSPTLYESPELAHLWPFGQARFGPADTGAAGNYIAQYTTKQIRRNKGQRKDDGYENDGYADPDGVWIPKPTPFLRMSTKPAIGLRWLEKYKTDLTHGYLVEDGYRQRIPRAYMKTLKRTDPNLQEEIDFRAYTHRRKHQTDNNEPARLAAAEIIHKNRNTQRDL